jgi:UDP-N-acetylmuramate dehydrogenase
MKPGQPLKDKTTFKIGGRAAFYCEPQDSEELAFVARTAVKCGVPLYILGAGSNILVSDGTVMGVVVKLSAPEFNLIRAEGRMIRAGAGVGLARLVNFARDSGLSGLEFLAGIPGTVGGALAMNAGCWGRDILSRVKSARVMDRNGKIINLPCRKISSGYRSSSLSRFIILDCVFSLEKAQRKSVSELIDGYLERRRSVHDLTLPNAGCIFKNPGRHSAGELLESCGLKGRSSGRAMISRKHANFILNRGNASARDVLKLMETAKSAVKRRFNIELEPEIKIWQ